MGGISDNDVTFMDVNKAGSLKAKTRSLKTKAKARDQG